MYNLLTAAAANPFNDTASPIIGLLDVIVGPALLIVGAIGAILIIILGVRFAKAEETDERAKAKTALKNAIIGFLIVFILLVALQIAMPALKNWYGAATAAV